MEREFVRRFGRNEAHFNRLLLYQGVLLATLGLLGPVILSQHAMHIYEDLSVAMIYKDTGALLAAASKLVLMNVCRMTPHYMGAFLINDAVHLYHDGKRKPLPNILFTYAMIFLIYRIIYMLYRVRYDFGIPAVLTVAFVLILSYLDLFSVNMWNKIVMVFTLLMSFQCLDVVPGLTQYGFGRGEVSMEVKRAARIIGQESALVLFALSIAAVFFLMVMIQVQLLIQEHVVKITEERNRRMEKELHSTQMEALKMRNVSEVQSLVHDLKSPLTTIQGLMSLAEIMEENPQIRQYFEKMSNSLEMMNNMISEILYEDKWDVFLVEDILHAVLAQVSIRIPNENLSCRNSCRKARIRGNKIRLTRALINLINNAWSAVDPVNGRVQVTASSDGTMVRFEVRDNGIGIAPENLERIWELGYSGHGSTGLGMAFTRQIVEKHGGTVSVTSELGKGTSAVIQLPETENTEEGEDDDGKEENTGY